MSTFFFFFLPARALGRSEADRPSPTYCKNSLAFYFCCSEPLRSVSEHCPVPPGKCCLETARPPLHRDAPPSVSGDAAAARRAGDGAKGEPGAEAPPGRSPAIPGWSPGSGRERGRGQTGLLPTAPGVLAHAEPRPDEERRRERRCGGRGEHGGDAPCPRNRSATLGRRTVRSRRPEQKAGVGGNKHILGRERLPPSVE